MRTRTSDLSCHRTGLFGLCAAQRCLDGSCQADAQRCVDVFAEANVCPPSRPFRCADGFCAASAVLCPRQPVAQAPCDPVYALPVRCADGSWCVRLRARRRWPACMDCLLVL